MYVCGSQAPCLCLVLRFLFRFLSYYIFFVESVCECNRILATNQMNYVVCHFQILGLHGMAANNLVAVLLLASICMAHAYPALLPYIYSEYHFLFCLRLSAFAPPFAFLICKFSCMFWKEIDWFCNRVSFHSFGVFLNPTLRLSKAVEIK